MEGSARSQKAFTALDGSVPRYASVTNPDQGPAMDFAALLGKVVRVPK